MSTQTLEQYMLIKKPDVSPNTMLSYLQKIKHLYFDLYPEDVGVLNLEKLLAIPPEIILDKILLKEKLSTQNVFNSAFYALTNNHCFKKKIAEIKEIISNEVQNNTLPSEYNIKNQITQEDLDTELETKRLASDNIYHLITHFEIKNVDMTELQILQQYVMLCLMCGKYIAPRRSRDYYDFKIKNIDQDKDNYLDQDTCEIVYNSFKTIKSHGQKKIKIPIELFDILNKWIAVNPYDYLFVNNNGDQLSSHIYSKKMNQIFGTKSGKSTNQLRHAFLQHTFPNAENMNKILNDMSTSNRVINYYVKDFSHIK